MNSCSLANQIIITVSSLIIKSMEILFNCILLSHNGGLALSAVRDYCENATDKKQVILTLYS